MKWEYIGAGLALIGIGLTMVLALPPPGWPTMPIWAVRFGIATGGVLIIVGAALIALGVLPWLIAYTLPVSFATLSAAAALIAVMALYWSPSADVTTEQDIREISREELARRSLEIVAEMREAAADFRVLLDAATSAELRRGSDGTRWTNEQLLFHMLFGYIITVPLLWMAKVLGYLPGWATKPFAALLNAGTVPFNYVNYLGSRIGGRIVSPPAMVRWFDRVTNRLGRWLVRESDGTLARGMHYPTRWDPFFKDSMTLADIYHYPTQHFGWHRRQLSL